MQDAIVMFLFVCTGLLVGLCFLYLAVFVVKAIFLAIVQAVKEIRGEMRKMEAEDADRRKAEELERTMR